MRLHSPGPRAPVAIPPPAGRPGEPGLLGRDARHEHLDMSLRSDFRDIVLFGWSGGAFHSVFRKMAGQNVAQI